ncbi:MAG: hypothetical protein HRT61_20470 [Ekhidna sp.]|nr:hypothetical protein [Ekhidna sp.]
MGLTKEEDRAWGILRIRQDGYRDGEGKVFMCGGYYAGPSGQSHAEETVKMLDGSFLGKYKFFVIERCDYNQDGEERHEDHSEYITPPKKKTD